MKKLNSPSLGRSKQGGIALVTLVIFVVVLLSLLTAMVAMSRATSQSTGEQTLKLQASAVLDQSNMLKAGFDLKSSLGTQLAEITFSDRAEVGLFDPNKPYASQQTPPGDALASDKQSARWLYANPYRASDDATTYGAALGKSVLLENVPEQAGPPVIPARVVRAPALLVVGLSDSVCKKINETTRNFSVLDAIPTTSVAPPVAAAITTYAAGIAADFDLSGVSYNGVKYRDGTAVPGTITGMGGASTGCFKTSTANVFVNIVK